MGSAEGRREGRYASALLDRFRLGPGTAEGGALAQARRSIHLHGFRHWLVRERDAFVQTAKAAVASGLAWLLAAGLLNVNDPVLASVAALVTVQVTVYQSMWRAVQYSAGIVAGMVAALAIGDGLGVNVLTMALVVIAGLVLGRTLRLGTQVNQVAVTALLVLSFGGNYGYARVFDSVIGAAVGVFINAVIAPPASPGVGLHRRAGLAGAQPGAVQGRAGGQEDRAAGRRGGAVPPAAGRAHGGGAPGGRGGGRARPRLDSTQ